MKNIAIIIVLGIGLASCEKFLQPEPDNRVSEEELLSIPKFAEGLLLNAYKNLPSDYDFSEDVASDDAVTNEMNSEFLKMANGQWQADNDPIGKWEHAFEQIYYINSFLERYEKVEWSWENETTNELHLQRLKGEIFGLRAWYEFLLLQHHAGEIPEGSILGFPIQETALRTDDNWNQSRNSFEECVAQIIEDCNVAIANLPGTYADSGENVIDEAMGARWTNRMTANAVRALKSKVLLYAASPAYNVTGDPVLWEDAALEAGEFLESQGGLAALSPKGLKFYVYKNGVDPDVIWSRAISMNKSIEQENFPPSLLGKGRLNPTQNLVDAFPMQNGFPIDHPSSGFDPVNPYSGRDPRLSEYIIYNGNELGFKGIIFTHKNAPLDGIDVQTNSTRTGYYMKKLLLDNVNVENPEVLQNHFYTYARFTEVFLNYAEAANEAWGPDGDGGSFGFTARDVIAAIRKRAGLASFDLYLLSLSSKEAFRELIKNERRLELCFEGQRFWDIRRWKEIDTMKEPVKGVYIDEAAGTYTYEVIENRVYQDYMIYGPVPRNEILKNNELVQNKGW